MYGDKYRIIVLVGELDHLMYPSLVIPHPYKASENAYSIVYMYNIVAYIERRQIVDCELLALFNSPPYAHPVEPVEYLMVGITAYPVLIVNEAAVDIFS